MKNLKKLILLLTLAPGLLQAQATFTDLAGLNKTPDNTNPIRATNALHGALTIYPDLTSFQNATAGASLTTEDFSNTLTPGAVTSCGDFINNATANPCFAAGAVQVGFTVLANDDNSDLLQDVVFIGIGAFGNTAGLVGANTFADSTEIQFTGGDVRAVGFDASVGFSAADITITAFDASNGLIGAFNLSLNAVPDTAFAGFISPLPISRVTVVGAGGQGDLISNLVFGASAPAVPVPTLSWVSMLLIGLGLALTAAFSLRRKAI